MGVGARATASILETNVHRARYGTDDLNMETSLTLDNFVLRTRNDRATATVHRR
jgi:hypothetical protein